MNKHYPYLIALLALVLSALVHLWSPVRPQPEMQRQPRAGVAKDLEEIQTKASPKGKTESKSKTGSKSGKRPGSDSSGRKRLASRGSTYRAEVYLLARTIHGEARGEPYIGQVAVGAVILNRVDNPLFPNTITGVVYEPGAFSAVSDGQIYMDPDAEALRAAEDAVNGWDPSGGALYYYNPAKATSAWIWQRPVIKVIGRHVFTK